MRAGNCLGGLGEHWEGWAGGGGGKKNNGGKEASGRSQWQGRGASVSFVISDPDDSDILELVNGPGCGGRADREIGETITKAVESLGRHGFLVKSSPGRDPGVGQVGLRPGSSEPCRWGGAPSCPLPISFYPEPLPGPLSSGQGGPSLVGWSWSRTQL